MTLAALGALAVLALGTAVVLSGGESKPAQYAAIASTVSDALTSSDPGLCEKAFTDRWLAQNFSSSSQEPIARCREATAEDPARKADAVVVSGVSVDGEKAQATAEVTGGNIGAGTLELDLVAEEGWRLDRLSGIRVEPSEYFAAQRESAQGSDVPPYAKPLVECMLDYGAEEVGATEIEESLLAGNEGYYAGAFPGCRQEFRAMVFSPVTIGAKTDHSPEELLCISRAASASIPDAELKRLFTAFAQQETPPALLEDRKDAAIARCTS